GRVATRGRRVREQRVIQGNQKRGSLTCAGLRLSGDIPARERDRQRLGLDWVHCVNPASRIPCRTGGARPRLSKLVECGSVINRCLYCCTEGLAGLAKSARKRYKAYQDGG